MNDASARWSFWIDRGGTFTDVVARSDRGELRVEKLLSADPEHYDDAPLEALRRVLGDGPYGADRVAAIRMGTTVATNALLERHGAAVCLVTTAGCEDLLEIGTQARPDLFALEIRKPEPLVREVIGVPERVGPDGHVGAGLDLRALRSRLEAALARGVRSLAVVFKNAYRNPTHEEQVGALARELGFDHVGLSHEVAREIGMTGRGDTTTADAYLTPLLRAYVDRFRAPVDDAVSLRFMQSSGGLADARRFSGKDAILSGPAGGVVACAHVARQAGVAQVVGFDMGGTSTDVCRVDLREGYERVFERTVAGVRLKAPMLNVVTIAAGGGSLLGFDGRRLTVGPESAGADPGPVCYRRPGGRLAVTDANAALGRVQPAWFPACFGPGADARLDAAASRAALASLTAEVNRATGSALSPEELAAGFVRIANDNMARALREISVARGYDVTDYALCCFGGAGAQHACAIADALGVRTVLVHPHAGVLSAYGIGLADVVHTGVTPVLQPLDAAGPAMEAGWGELERQGRAALQAQGVAAAAVDPQRTADLRYRGVDAFLNVPAPADGDPASWEGAFAAAHERLYGFARPGHPVEVVSVRVETIGASDHADAAPRPAPAQPVGPDRAAETVDVWFDRIGEGGARSLERVTTPVYRRDQLPPGAALTGPALIAEAVSTVVVDPGWRARTCGHGILHLEREQAGPAGRERLTAARDPVVLEIMGNLIMSIAEQMGATLRRVSLSVNIKERLDFSCAVFDRDGNLVANAPHIPVHLGAMSESVKAIQQARAAAGDLRPGDVIATNDPFAGGSHLPDVTVVTPVFVTGELTFWVASRGHHADVGGIVPGSMPPFSRTIDDEGVRLHDVLLVRDGRFRTDEVRALLTAGPHPVRGVDERLADLEAQVAANAQGVRLLSDMAARYGPAVVAAYMGHLQDDAAAALGDAIAALPDGTATFFDHLDDGARIQCAITVDGSRARLDFTGTDGVLPGNLNAPRAVTLAAVLYVFRTLVARPIPLNAGCFRQLEVELPPGSLLDPAPPAAVVGGNVETSQRICDVVYGALGKLAASQGTMNNLTFGADDFGYYETICGGAGAGFGFDGASAVHTHMTNTRITDPEVLELRFPVRLRRFAIRRGSGGDGVWRGGDGVVRALEFLRPMEAAVLSERRGVAPFGLNGADAGRQGRNLLERRGPDGRIRTQPLPGKVRLEVEAGDVLVVETPGGGGYDPTAREWATIDPALARLLFREQRWRGPTAGIAMAAVQANLIVLPARTADAFEAYCRRNPAPCPLLERLPAGDPRTRLLADGADLRSDLPRYRVYRSAAGEVSWEDVLDVTDLWQDDHVAFLLGCSFAAERPLAVRGIPLRHVELGRNVPMFRTRRRTRTEGPFASDLVVSMRPVPRELIKAATQATDPYRHAHGAPVHVGDFEALGIEDLARPDWGDPVPVRRGEVPVFWACGVTSQLAVQAALRAGEVERVIAHAPGHMFVGDLRSDALLER